MAYKLGLHDNDYNSGVVAFKLTVLMYALAPPQPLPGVSPTSQAFE